MSKVATRFAPSPTGPLHIGGVRTALFNWLFAKNKGGKFYLRIEDTDKERSKDEFKNQIIKSLKWIGIEHDDNEYIQSKKINEHIKIAEELLKNCNAIIKMANGNKKNWTPPQDAKPSDKNIPAKINFTNDILNLIESSDLAITRCGASTAAELSHT